MDYLDIHSRNVHYCPIGFVTVIDIECFLVNTILTTQAFYDNVNPGIELHFSA